jgi:hypothetical protein
MASQVTPRGSLGQPEETSPSRSFAAQLEENRTWNVLTLEFNLYALRYLWTQKQVVERYLIARKELSYRLRARYQVGGDPPEFPIEYVPWALLALGSGLALQAYLEPGALPSDLYPTIVGQLLIPVSYHQ